MATGVADERDGFACELRRGDGGELVAPSDGVLQKPASRVRADAQEGEVDIVVGSRSTVAGIDPDLALLDREDAVGALSCLPGLRRSGAVAGHEGEVLVAMVTIEAVRCGDDEALGRRGHGTGGAELVRRRRAVGGTDQEHADRGDPLGHLARRLARQERLAPPSGSWPRLRIRLTGLLGVHRNGSTDALRRPVPLCLPRLVDLLLAHAVCRVVAGTWWNGGGARGGGPGAG